MPSHPTSIWRRSPNKLRQNEIWLECFYFTSLFLGALTLFLVNLGKLPLLDLNEGMVAQVAREIAQGSETTISWIFPTLWGQPYLAQPPLVHDLIAIAYKLGGVSEFTTRLPGALLGAISVILVYNIGREIFVARLPALFSALVYLTCLPVVRLSRLAMLDGPLLCFELLTIWAILRSRRDLRWSLVAGIGLGLMGLTKGIVGLQILMIVGLFLFWDTPRLLTSDYFWRGLILGLLPCLVWYTAQGFYYHDLKTIGELLPLVWGQIPTDPWELKSPRKYYFLTSVQYLLPWLLVMFAGIKFASRNVHWGWGKLLIVWLGVYLSLLLLLVNRDNWSILPLYPALALAAGRQLDLIRNLPSYLNYPKVWTSGFALMALVALLAGLHWGIWHYVDFYLPFICGSLAITFTATAIALAQKERQFIPLLFWGLLVSMFLLLISPHWVWELNETEAVKPIADLIQQHTSSKQIVYTSMTQERPSLNFYSDRQIVPLKISDLQYHWQQESNVCLLLDTHAQKKLKIPAETVIKNTQFQSSTWVLAIKKSPVANSSPKNQDYFN